MTAAGGGKVVFLSAGGPYDMICCLKTPHANETSNPGLAVRGWPTKFTVCAVFTTVGHSVVPYAIGYAICPAFVCRVKTRCV